jgi:SAM-dependent methyltransferase
MGEYLNLLNCQDKFYGGPTRNMDPTFGELYFDGTRDTGYGGYRYDGRWKPVAEAVVKRYGLRPGDRVLDVGCGKGFFLADLVQLRPELHVRGTDVSAYAVERAHELVRPFITVGSADDLGEFADHSFDFVCAMNSLHFLTPDRVEVALREILRVGKPGKYFVQLDAFTSAVERERLLAWAPIIKTVYSVDDWHRLFAKVGYDGDYWWTFVRPLSADKPLAA